MRDHVLAAKAIRKELKQAFPKSKFSVTSESFSMGNSVTICWENGPDSQAVHKIVDKYQYGRFDGMTDTYEHTNTRHDLPQAMFVQIRKERSSNNINA